MEAFKVRCNFATSQRDRAPRTLEHTTLTRLMYVSRNPHRRTPYFTRLEHVRRLLRKINAHESWKLLDNPTKHKKKGSGSGLRQIDVDRLEALVEHVDKLISTAIPSAAARWTTELIEREHFVPLATAVVALLARILVLEKPLLRALKSVATEARILVPAQPSKAQVITDEPTKQRTTAPTPNVQQYEDVGQVITKQEASAQKLTVVAKKKKKKSGGGRFFQETKNATTSGVADCGIVKKRRESSPFSLAADVVGTSTATKGKKEADSEGETGQIEDLDAIFAELSD